jgi:hypothetical protein
VGWTNPPEERSRIWSQVGIVFAVVVALVVAAITGLVVLVAIAFSHVHVGGDAFKPTAAEARAAATTVPIRPSGCAAFVRVEKTAEVASDATAFGMNPEATPARANVALGWFHRALVDAYGPAEGPMRQRLRNVDAQVVRARRMIASWHGVVAKGMRPHRPVRRPRRGLHTVEDRRASARTLVRGPPRTQRGTGHDRSTVPDVCHHDHQTADARVDHIAASTLTRDECLQRDAFWPRWTEPHEARRRRQSEDLRSRGRMTFGHRVSFEAGSNLGDAWIRRRAEART